jgi:hypothetical protein
MSEGASNRYFLSYSRADQQFALRFATDLRAREVAIWIDQLDIRPSERWDRAIERAVLECCGMVVILSPRSVESDNVADEISYAVDRGKPVLPIMIERCSLPLRITRMQMIDATGDYDRALQQCLEAILFSDAPCGRATAAPPPSAQGIKDEELIRHAKEELVGILGPIAAIVVDKAAARASSIDEFYSQLADRIPHAADRERFLARSGKPAPTSATRVPSTPTSAKMTSTAIEESEVERLAAALTPHLGPMARIVVRRESANASSVEDLRQRLASLIRDDHERAQFLRHAEAKG